MFYNITQIELCQDGYGCLIEQYGSPQKQPKTENDPFSDFFSKSYFLPKVKNNYSVKHAFLYPFVWLGHRPCLPHFD